MDYRPAPQMINPEDQKRSLYMGLLKAGLSNMAAPPTQYKRSFGQQVAPGVMQGMEEVERYQNMIRQQNSNQIAFEEQDKGRQRNERYRELFAADPTISGGIKAGAQSHMPDKAVDFMKMIKAPDPAKFDINYDYESGKGYVTNPNDPDYFKVRNIAKRPEKGGGSGGSIPQAVYNDAYKEAFYPVLKQAGFNQEVVNNLYDIDGKFRWEYAVQHLPAPLFDTLKRTKLNIDELVNSGERGPATLADKSYKKATDGHNKSWKKYATD